MVIITCLYTTTGVWSLQRQLNKLIDKLPPGKLNNAKKMPALRIASWNVRTMRPGLSNDRQQINDSRKTAIIDSELDRLNIDIAGLQETRLAENGSLKEQRYTLFWQRKSIEEKREHGVGFAVKNSLLTVTVPPVNGSARILTIRLSTRAGRANIIMSIYAPTLCFTVDTKDQFYEELDVAIGNIPKTEQLYILGEFNARVGADHESWSTCLGQHGMGKINENGQRLLELCCHYELSITNTFFGNKPCHKVSWIHPRSGHWHQLGSVLGPLLFSIYCIELSSVFESHQHSYHIYTDDSQLYVEFPRDQPAQAVTAANRLSHCITDERAWLLLNNLMLNRDKTEATVIAAVRAHATVDVVVDVCGCIVTLTPYVRDIGVWLDSAMSMAKNVSRVCQMAYCQLRSIARIRRSLMTIACRTGHVTA